MHSIEDIETWVGAPLPVAYRAFLESVDVELAASDLVMLYGRELFIERNDTFEVKQYWPGFITIGNDSGGMEFILPIAGGPVSMIDGGSPSVEDAEHVADDFSEWLAAGCPIPEDELDPDEWPVDPATSVHVYLESRPAALKNLLMIKDRLGIDTSIAVLKTSLDSIPCMVADHLTFAQARYYCQEVNAIDPCLGIRLASDPSVRLLIGSSE